MQDSKTDNAVKQKRPRGRPKVGELPQMTFKMSQDQIDKINAIAKQDNINRSALIRKAIDFLIKMREGKPTPAACLPRMVAKAVPLVSADAVREAFAACAAHFPLPEGVSVKLDAERLDGGRWRIRLDAADSTGLFWSKDACPHASAVYRPHGSGDLNAATVFAAFADKLDGLAGKPVETMPDSLKSLCAGAIRQALGIFAEAAEEEEEESTGPRP